MPYRTPDRLTERVTAYKRGDIFHTYSCYVRGNELFNIHYHYLDVVPKGRDENGRGPFWVRRHDEYEKDERIAVVDKLDGGISE
jgi:predicted dithiol-disulfide oxidoreductase (DUF899 family)